MTRCPTSATLFPYTTLFRSVGHLLRVELPFRRHLEGLALVRDRGEEEALLAIAGDDRRSGVPTVERRLARRSEEHTSELQSLRHLVCRLLLEKKKKMM